jgi:hypothetical protein
MVQCIDSESFQTCSIDSAPLGASERSGCTQIRRHSDSDAHPQLSQDDLQAMGCWRRGTIEGTRRCRDRKTARPEYSGGTILRRRNGSRERERLRTQETFVSDAFLLRKPGPGWRPSAASARDGHERQMPMRDATTPIASRIPPSTVFGFTQHSAETRHYACV